MNLLVNPRLIFAICSLALVTSCGGRSPGLQTEEQGHGLATDSPLARFEQELTMPEKELVLKAGQTTTIPVTVRNLTGVTLSSSGRYPITLSYRFFQNGKMWPIEGDRTLLSGALKAEEQ